MDARQSSGRLSRGSGIIRISGTSLRDWKCRRHGAKIVPFVSKSPRQLKLVARHADLLAPSKGPRRGPLKAETRVRIP